MDLPEFLLARMGEREAQGPYIHQNKCGVNYELPCDCGEPARVLAWCAALRAVVAQYQRAVDADDDDVDMETKWITSGVREALERVLLALAQPFAEHRDYRPEWG